MTNIFRSFKVLRSGVTEIESGESVFFRTRRFEKFSLVRMRGLEPPRCHHHRLLRPARLPVPPHPQGTGCHYANGFRRCQPGKSCVRERGREWFLTVESVVPVPSPNAPVAIPITIAIAAVTPEDVADRDAVTPRTASIPTTITSVVAVDKLATLLIQPHCSTTASLAQRVS
jgi:hypothetical protein